MFKKRLISRPRSRREAIQENTGQEKDARTLHVYMQEETDMAPISLVTALSKRAAQLTPY